MKATFNYTTSSSRQSFSASCISEEDNNIYGSFYNQVAFSTSLVIAISSPVTVVGNGLILAAIWKKTFVRTPFHSLLSGLALTDFCTGLIAQPFYSARMFLFSANTEKAICDKPTHYVTIATIADGSATYFITITILLITLMSVERWLHMSRRSSLTSSRKCLTVGTLLLIPFSLVVFRILNDIDGTYVRELNTLILIMILLCFFALSTAYFKVFRIIRHHQLQVQANEPSQNFGQPAINLAKYKKSVVSIIYILVLFCFCVLPFLISIGVYLSLGNNSAIAVSYNVSLMLLFLSSSLNPCLYLWRMDDIRNAVKNLV